MMKLYGVRGWGSAITEAMLALVRQPYEFVDVEGFDQPGEAQERLARVNPLRQVPVLVLGDGGILTESAAIALWLAEQHPELAPSRGTAEHRRFLRWLIWLVANVYPTFTYGDVPDRWCPSAPDELKAATDAYRKRLYLQLEAEITGPYLLGEQPSALDCYAAAMVGWWPGTPWFEANTPKFYAAAMLMRRHPQLAEVMAANKQTG
ncbi:hypothetical protein NS365_16065 [Aureimonas ureilytica]|uniref:Glutathione S-transferase n=1 Tax=Aureimonas ureilytica TaxID=401562 RepID=A0A175RK93_9HYPH|nr:glutathione S-transferase family protein [Aureimonas ureilytica]KTR04190.1 hypothetical protein NS365_16065 [Aureimonas ureilytica]